MNEKKILVAGATGKIGQLVCRRALDAGHRVTALARNPAKAAGIDKRLNVVAGDALNPADITNALAADGEQDAVIVCLGATGLRDKTTLPNGTRNIVGAMAETPGKRLVVLSAIGAGDSWRQLGLLPKLLFKTLLRDILQAHQLQEDAVCQSALSWTIVRAAVLNDKPASGQIIADNNKQAGQISRANVAAFLAEEATAPRYMRQCISITA